MGIRHSKIITAPEGADPTKVRTSDWLDDHIIDDGSIGLSKIVGLAPVAVSGDASDLTGLAPVATSGSASDIAGLAAVALTGDAADIDGLAAVAISGLASDLGGTLAAARLPAFSGDVTTNAGASVTTIALNVVTNAKAAQMPALTMKGNALGVLANATDLTAATIKALLAITTGDVSGLNATLDALNSAVTSLSNALGALAEIASSGSADDLIAGTVPAARMPALTGEVTSTSGTTSTTIAPNAVTNAKAAQMPALTLKGNATGAPANATDLASASVKTMLAIATGDITGLATIASTGSAADLAAGVVPEARLPEEFTMTASAAAAPAPGATKIFGSAVGGRGMLAIRGSDGATVLAQPYLGREHAFAWITTTANNILTIGLTNVTIIGAAGQAVAATNSFTASRRCLSVSPATAAASCGFRTAAFSLLRQKGWHITYRFGIQDAVLVTTGRTFVGLQATIGAPTDVEPSSFANIVGVGCDGGDVALQLYSAGAVAQTRTQLVIDTGPNAGGAFPTNTTSVDVYEASFWCPAGGDISWEVTRVNTDDKASGVITAGAALPAATTLLAQQAWRTNGSTAAAVTLAMFSMFGGTDP